MLFALLYILVVYGPWFIIPAVPLGLATAVTVARVHEPRRLLAIAILTSLVGTLSVAETLIGGYDVFAGRFWLTVECTELDVVAVVLGFIALTAAGRIHLSDTRCIDRNLRDRGYPDCGHRNTSNHRRPSRFRRPPDYGLSLFREF